MTLDSNINASISLKSKTIHGISWSMLDNIANSGITFLVGLVLARLLSPIEFGILGMITIFIAISNSIVDSGFSNALIRKNDTQNIDYNTVFYFNLITGIALYVVLFVSAPIISKFFKEPVLTPITRIIGITIIINALSIIQRTLLIKNVDFKTQTKVSCIASIISGICGIGMALLNCGIWSLVGQQISRQLFNTMFLWIFSKWRPTTTCSYQSFLEMFGFGSRLLISGLIDTLYKNVYYIIIGKFYNATQLGQYTRAELFNSVFSSNLTSVVQRVSFPVLSCIQEDEQRLKMAYRRLIKATMFITFPCMLGLAAIAKPLVLLLIGSKWLPCVIFLQILTFQGMMYPLQAINLNILQVKGRSDTYLRLEILKKCIYILPVMLGIFFNIYWMLISSTVISIFITYPLNSYFSGKIVGYKTMEQIKDIFPSFILALLTFLLICPLSILNISIPLMLFLQLLIGSGFIYLICELFHIDEYIAIKQVIISHYPLLKNKIIFKSSKDSKR